MDPLAINPGDLRHVITIQAPEYSGDSGQPDSTWSDVITARASIRALTLREQALQEGTLTSLVSHLITLRYPGDNVRIVSGQRVVCGDSVFNVQVVDNVMLRNRVLRLQCQSVDAASVGSAD